LHVITTRAGLKSRFEEDQVKYHAPGKFDPISGEYFQNQKKTTTQIPRCFGLTILDFSKNNKKKNNRNHTCK
jgi:1-deoxy-D-xylulose-5-phosphate synthase